MLLDIITYSQIHSIMQNKPNLRNDKMSANLLTTNDYEENDHSGHEKTKPIQTQFKPNLSQNKPNSKPNKANNQSSLIDNQLIKGTVEVIT